MTLDQFLVALTGPVIILAVALILVVLTRWHDEREAHRRAAKKAASHWH